MKKEVKHRRDYFRILSLIFLFPLWIFAHIMRFYDLVSSKLFRKRVRNKTKQELDFF